MCRRLAKLGYFAIAPELFARQGDVSGLRDNKEIYAKVVLKVPDAQVMSDLDAAADYAHNDLNLSNILTDGEQITGVVDWDEFGLGSRALDLVVLALDCQERGAHAAADRLLASAASAVGGAGLRCLVSYRALAALAENTREGQASHAEIQAIEAVLAKLRAPGN